MDLTTYFVTIACENGGYRSEDPYTAAVSYLYWGFAVYPIYTPNAAGICSCSKGKACPSPGKHPRTQRGMQDATRDWAVAKAWWEAHPDANVGIAPDDELLVIDLDRHGDSDGFETLQSLEATLGPLPTTYTSITGSGSGEHRLFSIPRGFVVKNTAGMVGPGIDIRAKGGGIVVPPSRHVSGGQYRWALGLAPEEVDLAELPEAWREYIASCGAKQKQKSVPTRKNHDSPRAVRSSDDEVIPEGQRNQTLTSYAGTMRQRGMGEAAIEAALKVDNAARCDPPLSDQEVIAIARSVAKYPPQATAISSTPAGSISQFPVDVLPERVREFVTVGATALSVPPDLITVPLLTYAGAVLGNRRMIELKTGYRQRPILFTAVVAPPGSAKSPALDLARAPLERMQKEAYERFTAEDDAVRLLLAAWESNRDQQRGPRPVRPKLEHFYTTDATMEAVVELTSGSPGIVLSKDEIVSWVKSCDAYRGGKGGDRQNWLSAWSGSAIKVDRKGKDSIYIQHPHICVTGGVQPDLLIALADEAGRRDGFIERILWSYPEVHATRWTEDTVPAVLQEEMYQLFLQLRGGEEITYHLDAEAKPAWATWYEENARASQGAEGYLAGVYAKLPNQVARLALILQCLADPDISAGAIISLRTLEGAFALAEYFVAHAERVLAHIDPAPTGTDATLPRRVLKKLQSFSDWASRSDLHAALGGHVPGAALQLALASLKEEGAVESSADEVGTRGRPGEYWRVIRYHQNNESHEEPA